jgi:hypothetical protein
MSTKAEARAERKLNKETSQRRFTQLIHEPSIYDKTDFDSEREASDWMYEVLSGEECFDNYRFCFTDQPNAEQAYEELASGGCCGSADYDINVKGRLARIGCNFGH